MLRQQQYVGEGLDYSVETATLGEGLDYSVETATLGEGLDYSVETATVCGGGARLQC